MYIYHDCMLAIDSYIINPWQSICVALPGQNFVIQWHLASYSVATYPIM